MLPWGAAKMRVPSKIVQEEGKTHFDIRKRPPSDNPTISAQEGRQTQLKKALPKSAEWALFSDA